MKIITGTKDPSSFKESEGRQLVCINPNQIFFTLNFMQNNQFHYLKHFVDTIYVHPEYESTNNDIAIIKIKGQFTFNENVTNILFEIPKCDGLE